MQDLINSIYTSLINDGYAINRQNIIYKNSRKILPDALKQFVATTLSNIDQAAQISTENLSEVYNGIVTKYNVAIESQSDTTGEDVDKETVKLKQFYPDRTSILNERLHTYFKDHIVYTRDELGTVIPLSRQGTEGNQWRLVNDMYSGIMLLDPDTKAKFKQLFTNVMQEPLNGASYEIYNTDGSIFKTNNASIHPWPKVIDIAVARAASYVKQHSSTHEMPNSEFINFMKTARTLDPDADGTLLPSIASACNPGPNGFILNQWASTPDLSVPMPKTITNDDVIPAFCYVDLKKFITDQTPEFDGFMTSIDPAVRGPFMACLYACVFEPCHHSLVVWLHGEGSNGKSQLFDAMNEYFGGSLVGSMSTKSLSGDFGMEGLIGKRIIIWGDCQNGNALSTNEVHGITGGDNIAVNRKNKPIISYKFKSLLFIGANKAPEIKLNAVNETRRVLYVPMSDPDLEVMQKYCEYNEDTGEIKRHSTGQPIFKSYDLKGKLIKEMPAIMAKCKEEFTKYCKPPYNQMTVPKEAFDLMTSKCEGGENLVFNDFFQLNYRATDNTSDYVDAFTLNAKYLEHVHGVKSAKQQKKYSYELADLKRFILTTYPNVEFGRRNVDGTKVSCYNGLKYGAEITSDKGITSFGGDNDTADFY